MTTETTNLRLRLPPKPKRWTYKRILSIILFLLFIGWGFSGLNYKGLANTFINGITGVIRGLMNPDIEFLTDMTIDGLPYAMIETLAIAIGGTFVSGILAIPVALLASENIVGRKRSKIGKVLIIIIRTFPEIILALIFIGIVGVGAPAGMMALAVHSVGMLAKLYSESIESMDIGVKEGVESCGGDSSEVLFRAVIPQVAPEFMSYTLFRFEINMRAAAILGLVGAGGIGVPLILATESNNDERVAIILYALIITITIVDLVSGSIRKRLTK